MLAENVQEALWFGDEDPNRTELEASQSLAAATAEASGLKPFPAVAQRALGLLSNPDVRVREVEAALEQDTALAARVLRVANSAAFGGVSRIDSIEQGVVRLGLRTVHEIVAATATLGMFDDATGVGLRFRDHCAGVAAIVRVLASESRVKGVSQAFLVGLMHDLGKLLTLQVGEFAYDALDPEVRDAPERLHLLEREALGYDHAVLGAHVLRAWKMPEFVSQAVAWHHQPGRAYEVGGPLGITVALLRLADPIEYRLALEMDATDAFLDALDAHDASSYSGVSGAVIGGMWAKLADARSDLLSALRS